LSAVLRSVGVVASAVGGNADSFFAKPALNNYGVIQRFCCCGSELATVTRAFSDGQLHPPAF
jgi:hypothetical protein